MTVNNVHHQVGKLFSAAGKNFFTVLLILLCVGFQNKTRAQTVTGTVTDESGKSNNTISNQAFIKQVIFTQIKDICLIKQPIA